MTLSKHQTYFALHGAFILAVLLFQTFWLFSRTTDAWIEGFGRAAQSGKFKSIETMTIDYAVNGQEYETTVTRNATPAEQQTIRVRYSKLWPDVCRLDTFEGNWLQPIIIYIIFFIFTTILFFVPNKDVLPKGTVFIFSKQRPWIKIKT